MLKKLSTKQRKLKSSYVLVLLFLFYIVYVGLSAFPEALYHLGGAFHWDTGFRHFIDTIDEQYEGMLTTKKQEPLLQNKGTYINLNGLMARAMGQTMMNERVKLTNGHLTSIVPDAAAPEDIQSAAENVNNFYRKQTARGGNFLFVMVSSQVSKYEDLLPTGYSDTTNDTADAFLALLEEAGVPYLDLREVMQQEGISVTDIFYTTDHHWTPQGGFWAFGKIMDKLAQMGAIQPVDPFYTDPDNYVFETYAGTFLGSSGKRTGIYYSGLDDSILIQPDFDTDISVTIEDWDVQIQGRFENVCYNSYAVHNYDDPDFYQENSYGLYGWGDTPLTQWRNEQAPLQGKFLLIGESFGNVPYSLMSLCLSECDEMDMRHYTGDFQEYFDSFLPDTVVMEVNVDQTLSPVTTHPYFPEG